MKENFFLNVSLMKEYLYQRFTYYIGNHPSARRLTFIMSACYNYYNSNLKPINQIEVLDVGCGAGPITSPVAAIGFKVLGIDIDPRRIDFCKGNNILPNLTYDLNNVENLNTGKKFDIILLSEVLEHQEDPIKFLYKIEKLLAFKGIIIITIPNGYGAYENFERLQKLRAYLKISKVFTFLRLYKVYSNLRDRLKEVLPFFRVYADEIPNDAPSNPITCPHVQFFSMRKIKEILVKTNLTIVEKKNGHFFLDTFPGDILCRWNKNLIFLDGYIANFLPSFLVNSWFFVCERRKYNKSLD